MKKSMIGAGALVMALLVTSGADAQQKQTQPPDQPNPKEAGAQQKQPRASAQPKAQGENTVWRMDKLINDGKDDSAAVKKVPAAADEKNFLLPLGNGECVIGTYKRIPGKQFKGFDAVGTSGPGKGMRFQGIYQVKGDTLELCFAPAGKARPTEFTAKKGSGNRLVVLKRIPAAQLAKRPGPIGAKDAEKIGPAAIALVPELAADLGAEAAGAGVGAGVGAAILDLISAGLGKALNAAGNPGNPAPGAAPRAAGQQKGM
jgi:uncharacterized protein (TIGR03067 family)